MNPATNYHLPRSSAAAPSASANQPASVDPLPVEPLFTEPPHLTATLQDILDYASPRQRTKIRLPTNSKITCNTDGPGVRIAETLAGRATAVVAMIFALFILAEWGAITVGIWQSYHHHTWAFLTDAWLLLLFWLAYLVLLLVVVQRTWRKTILRVDTQRVLLQFKGPLHRTSYRWTTNQLAAVQPTVTYTADGAWPLGELCLHLTTGGRVHLFTDHRLADIERLAANVCAALTTNSADAGQTGKPA